MQILKYLFILCVLSVLSAFLIVLFEGSITPEERENQKRKLWEMRRENGAPLLTDKELLEREKSLFCYRYARNRNYTSRAWNDCDEIIALNRGNIKLSHMTKKQKIEISIWTFCRDWKMLNYESEENCETTEAQRYNIKLN